MKLPVFAILRQASIPVVALFVLFATPVSHAQVESENFDGGVFTNPFFQHAFEFDDDCCREIVNRKGNFALHLRPNTDMVSFDLPPGSRVRSIEVTIEDFEGGFTGVDPTSVVIVRAASGDFVVLIAEEFGVREVLRADINTPGKISGDPLGEIVSLQFQAANEGNAKVPGIGAFYDDITVELMSSRAPGDTNCDGSVDLIDVGPFITALLDPARYKQEFPDCDINTADVNDDGSIDLTDVEPFIELLLG